MIKANKALIFQTLSDAQNNIDKIHHVDENGFTPLFFSTDLSVLSFLLDKGLNINHQNKDGLTPLMLSVKHPHDDFHKIKFLIEKGADVNLLDNNYQNALFHSNSLLYIQTLVEAGININQVNKWGDGILSNRLDYEAYESFDYLLDQGVDASPVNDWGLNVLFDGSLGLNYVKRLIDSGANPYQITKEGRNVLSAVSSENVMDFYVEIGVDSLHVDNEGNNLFLQKVQHYTEDIYPVIAKYGVDINLRNNNGLNIVELLLTDIDDYQYMIDRIIPYYKKKIDKWIELGLNLDSSTKNLIEHKLFLSY